MGFISTVLWFWSVVYWFWRSVISMWTLPLRLTVRFAIAVMAAMSAADVQVPAQQREEFYSTSRLPDAIKDHIEKTQSKAAPAQGVLAPLPHPLYKPKTELELDLDHMHCAPVLQGGSTDQAPTTFKEAHDCDNIWMQLSYTDGVVKVILTSNPPPDKTLKKTLKKTPASWGAIIGQGWPVYTGPSYNDYYAPFPSTKTHIILEVGLYGQVLSGDGTGTIMDVYKKTPKGAVMGDRVEYQVEAVPEINGRFEFKYHLVAHHWAATRVKYDLPASTCKDLDHAHYHAMDTAHFAALRRTECW